ncbi:MAG: dienelactone hydrolase family protein [Planctomycetota bacterium]
MRPSRSMGLTALSLLLLAACGEAETDAPADAASGAAMTGPRVPAAPTADDQLPSAIIGEAGPLMGVDLQYLEGDTLTTGYLAVPEGEGPFPALIIVHEWNGLVDRVRQVADNFAAEGYVTLAADMYQGRTGSSSEENIALMTEVKETPDGMIANLNAAVAYLKGRDDVTGRVGAMGWCFGGGVALSFGLDGDDHEATAIFYGRLVDDPERLAHMDHEVYGTFAELDTGIPTAEVEAFEAALRAAGVENDLHIYDAVNHGFWLRVDGAPEVRTEAALDAWQRLKAYLDRTLGAGM